MMANSTGTRYVSRRSSYGVYSLSVELSSDEEALSCDVYILIWKEVFNFYRDTFISQKLSQIDTIPNDMKLKEMKWINKCCLNFINEIEWVVFDILNNICAYIV